MRRSKAKIFCEIYHDFLGHLGQSVQNNIVEYLHKLRFQVYSVSLADLSTGSDFDKHEYIRSQLIMLNGNVLRLHISL